MLRIALDNIVARSTNTESSFTIDKHSASLDVRQSVIAVLRHPRTSVHVLVVSLIYLERAKDTAWLPIRHWTAATRHWAAGGLLLGAIGLAYRVSEE